MATCPSSQKQLKRVAERLERIPPYEYWPPARHRYRSSSTDIRRRPHLSAPPEPPLFDCKDQYRDLDSDDSLRFGEAVEVDHGLRSWCPGIGLLRVNFEGEEYTGTATVITNERSSCILTCAQNVVEYDKNLTMGPVYATDASFELRDNKHDGKGSDLIQEYKITNIDVHPDYFNDPPSNSGYDLALCKIAELPTETEKHSTDGIPIPTLTARAGNFIGKVAVVGFPGDNEDEKQGMAEYIPRDKREGWTSEDKQILVYDFIDTSPGQTGSPIMHLNKKSCEIIGVHTGGSQIYAKKWGTYITQEKLKWIMECLNTYYSTDKKTLWMIKSTDAQSFHLARKQ